MAQIKFAYEESEVKDFSAKKETGYVLPVSKENKLIVLDDIAAIAACVKKMVTTMATTTDTEATDTTITISGLKKFTAMNKKGQSTVLSINGKFATKILIPAALIEDLKPTTAEKAEKKTIRLGYYQSIEFFKVDPSKVRLIPASLAMAKKDARWKDQFEGQAFTALNEVAMRLSRDGALKVNKICIPAYQGRYEQLVRDVDFSGLKDGDVLIAYDTKDNGGKYQLTVLSKVLREKGFEVKGLVD